MDKIQHPETKTHLPYLLFALTGLFIIRVLPILKSPLSTYGYDYGFYYHAANNADKFHLGSLFQNAIWGGYNNPIFMIGNLLHIPGPLLLNELYVLATIGLGLALYSWMKLKNPLAGIMAVVLFAASQVQTGGYVMFLWKNMLALPLLLLAFKFLEQKRYAPLVACVMGIFLLHRTTAIICLLTIGIYTLIELIRQKKFRALFGHGAAVIITGAAGYHLLHLKAVILDIIYNNNYYVTTGLFMEGHSFLSLWWPILLLALPGLYFYVKDKKHPLLLVFTGILLSWIAFKLPFYRRLLLYLDISLIAFAAYFLSKINYGHKSMKIALAVAIGALMIRSGDFALSQFPLITKTEVAEIKNFHPQGSAGFILVVSANDAPWVLAYAPGQRLGAPGLLEDPHTYDEWKEFWQGQNHRQFLSNYPRPLYFYQRSYRLPPVGAARCLIPLTQNFSEVDYKCLEKTLPN